MTLAFTPPTSGPVLAALVEAFDLRRFDRQAALSTRNARRYLGGERVAPDAETAVHRARPQTESLDDDRGPAIIHSSE